MVEPYDAVNRTVLLYNYRTFVKGEDTSREDVLFKAGSTDESFLDTIDLPFLREPEKLTFSSLFEITETIIEAFGLRVRTEELPYLIAFQDILFDYEKNNTNSIPIFLSGGRRKRIKKCYPPRKKWMPCEFSRYINPKGWNLKRLLFLSVPGILMIPVTGAGYGARTGRRVLGIWSMHH